MVPVITRQEAVALILSSRGAFFSAIFRKRTTGETRKMNCRRGVRKYLQGGAPAYNMEERGLISVYDVRAAGYRCIPVEGLRALRIGGQKYIVEQP